ncbi:hypothetical protein [Clostridium thailandense]|uniref:hypothetical protein n=1 Tax=Clostridium thailandense TaxID=2794346 RepID=UPI0039895346
MVATVWNNGSFKSSGSGYGIKLSKVDRDIYFKKEWTSVILELGEGEVIIEVNVNKDSFWSKCRELLNKDIGVWLIKNENGSWKKGKPPKLKIENISGNRFKVESL